MTVTGHRELTGRAVYRMADGRLDDWPVCAMLDDGEGIDPEVVGAVLGMVEADATADVLEDAILVELHLRIVGAS